MAFDPDSLMSACRPADERCMRPVADLDEWLLQNGPTAYRTALRP